jgi:hypothetical protein
MKARTRKAGVEIEISRPPSLAIEVGADGPREPIGPGCSQLQVWPHRGAAAYCFERFGRYWIDIPGVASFGFAIPTEFVTAIPHPPARPGLIRVTYERSVLPLVLQAGGAEVLHASAVYMRDGVVALCGSSGVGKSTTAMALGRRGHPLWADDVVALDMTGRHPEVMPLSFELRLRTEAASLFGEKPGAIQRLCPSGPRGNGAEPESARLLALCVLSRADERESIVVERLGAAAVPALLTHAYCFSLQQPVFKRRMVQHYLELAASIPVFVIHFRPGLERLSAVADVIEQVAGGEA